ncbi:MAG: hypothetical protein WDZ90_01195 [Candidatus Paceibacterota bacterium]
MRVFVVKPTCPIEENVRKALSMLEELELELDLSVGGSGEGIPPATDVVVVLQHGSERPMFERTAGCAVIPDRVGVVRLNIDFLSGGEGEGEEGLQVQYLPRRVTKKQIQKAIRRAIKGAADA